MYEQAEQRVKNSLALSMYSEFILADWPEGEEHWEWVVTADESEILDWVQSEGDLD